MGNEEEIRSLECTITIADMRRSSEDERDRARRERRRIFSTNERIRPKLDMSLDDLVHGEENTGK